MSESDLYLKGFLVDFILLGDSIDIIIPILSPADILI